MFLALSSFSTEEVSLALMSNFEPCPEVTTTASRYKAVIESSNARARIWLSISALIPGDNNKSSHTNFEYNTDQTKDRTKTMIPKLKVWTSMLAQSAQAAIIQLNINAGEASSDAGIISPV